MPPWPTSLFFCLWSWCHIQKVSMKIENKKACKEANFGAWWSKQKPTVTLSFTLIVYFCWYSSEETLQKQSEAGFEPKHSGFTTFAADPVTTLRWEWRTFFSVKKKAQMGTDSKMLAPLLLSHNNKKKVLNFNAEAIRRKIKKPIQFVFYVNKVGLFHLLTNNSFRQ